jgi:hypothetical protein
MKTRKQIFAIVLGMMFALAIVPTLALSQNKNNQDDNDLVGVWQIAASATVDCATGQPDGQPTTPVNYSFNLGGTMTETEANAIDGPYRSSAQGIWKHVSGRNYTALFTNYSFNPDRSLAVILTYRTNLQLSRDLNTATENGTAEVALPDGTVVATVCFADAATRMRF